MKKQKTFWLSGLVIAMLCSCGGENKTEVETKDSTPVETKISASETPKSTDPLVKDWKATELVLAGTKLTAEAAGGLYFSFNADSSFSYTESGTVEKGKWSIDKDRTKITLKYTEGNRTVVQKIKEFTPEKLVVDYEDHGMKRSVTMVPGTKP